MSDYGHILPKFRDVMQLSDQERIASIGRRWVDYGFAEKIHGRLFAKLSGHLDTPDFLITGQSRMGKTTLINRFINAHGTSFVNERCECERPVIKVEVTKPNLKQFFISLLECCISPYNPDATENKLRFQVRNMLKDLHVKMLVIDEIQVILNGTSRETAELMNEIKNLSNTMGIAIVGVGMPGAKHLLTLDDQYAGRFVAVSVPLWTANMEFRQFLKGFEACLPLKQPSGLANKEMAAFILKKSGGITAYVEQMILCSARLAIETGKEHIDISLLDMDEWVPNTSGIAEVAL